MKKLIKRKNMRTVILLCLLVILSIFLAIAINSDFSYASAHTNNDCFRDCNHPSLTLTPKPSPTPKCSVTPKPTITTFPSPTVTQVPSLTPTETPTPTMTLTPTPTKDPEVSITPTDTPTPIPTLPTLPFQMPGPPQGDGGSQGQVLGASTLAATGSIDQTFITSGIVLLTISMYGLTFKKSLKKSR